MPGTTSRAARTPVGVGHPAVEPAQHLRVRLVDPVAQRPVQAARAATVVGSPPAGMRQSTCIDRTSLLPAPSRRTAAARR